MTSRGSLWFHGKLGPEHRDRAMLELVASFPTLADYPALEQLAVEVPACRFNVEDFEAWARIADHGHGMYCAAQFILSVWNPDDSWPIGPFKLHEALGCWDREHHDAFAAWVIDPWWP